MADFCNQCAADLGLPQGDFKGRTRPADTATGRYASVICEGCGVTVVDQNGNCVSMTCFKWGHIEDDEEDVESSSGA